LISNSPIMNKKIQCMECK